MSEHDARAADGRSEAGALDESESSLIWATMVRVYLSESDHGLRPLLKCLHDELGVLGATVTRGVAGFGASGVVHSAGLVDLSTDLPLVLEFFDRPDRARAAIERIKDFVEPGHVVSWSVSVECGDGLCRPRNRTKK